jgi:hypothetical protein
LKCTRQEEEEEEEKKKRQTGVLRKAEDSSAFVGE